MHLDTLKLPVYGMNCTACATHLEKALNALKGISCTVNFALQSAQIYFEKNKEENSTLYDIVSLLEKKGYQTDTETIYLDVNGWHLKDCVTKTEHVINKHPFTFNVRSNFATGKIQFQCIQNSIKKSQIKSLSEQCGYSLIPQQKQNRQQQKKLKLKQQEKENLKKQHQLIFAILLSTPFLLNMLFMLINQTELFLSPWITFVFATIIQFFIGARFYKGAYNSLKNSTTNMDVLICLGTSAAYFYSLYILFAGLDLALYFESSSLVITLVTLGKYLENHAKQNTHSAIDALMALRPDSALVKKGKQFIDVDVDDVQIGDLVQIRIAEKIPVDGIIIEGQSYLDESLLTGESKPLFKNKNKRVIAGSLNGDGVLLIKTLNVGDDTRLNQIIALVEKAQMSKAPILQVVDKISAIFVPMVLLISVVTFCSWYLITADFQQALLSSIAVLVIACPCALGLATPTAVLVGTGLAARNGILIKDIQTLQQAHKINTIVFDKTGTLTQGKGEITKVYTVKSEQHSMLSPLLSLQQGSQHPIANAIKQYCQKEKIELHTIKNIKAIHGEGLYAPLTQQNDSNFIAGNLKMMHRFHISIPLNLHINELDSVVYVAQDNKFIGYLCINDALRKTSFEAIQSLQRRHLNTILLSGDKQSVVQSIAQKLNINIAFGELSPQQKLEKLIDLQKNQFVAMLGDGVNDAPALAQADISIAMSTGSDVAKESASITLMRNDPRLVAVAIDISKATWLKINQNLFWAFIFNSIAIPAAAFGYLSPTIAGMAMALSSITVLSNSLLLKNIKIQELI